MRKIASYFMLPASCFMFFSACGSDDTSSSSSAAASFLGAVISASAGLTSFTYHSSTAYKANFGDVGVVLSSATSSATTGHEITGYAWEQISGPAVTFTSGTSSSTVTFTVPAMTTILHANDQYRWQVLPVSRNDTEAEFRLTVSDADGHSDKTTFTVYLYDNGNEIKTSTGLQNVGIGEKVYLAGPSWKANTSTASTAVADWTWVLTVPTGSSAAISNGTSQIANFTPDVAGSYTVTYSSTSPVINGALTVTASSFVGVGTIAGTTPSESVGQCGACHDGSDAADVTTSWKATGHSSMFEQVISSYKSKAPQPYCWECHTTGYNTNTSASNGGFDDLVSAAGYSFPSAGTTWNAFTAANPTLAPLANIQCEDCHGPGAAHKGDTTKISYATWNAGICGKCHEQEVEWKNSAHNSTGIKNNAGRYQLTSWYGAACARCHSSGGFAQEAAGTTVSAQSSSDFLVTCQACHDPHSVSADTPSGGATSISGNDSTQLRLKGNVTMKDDARTVVNAGKAAVCYECHDGNYSFGETDCDSNADGTADVVCSTIDQAATQYHRAPHANTQAMVLEGVGALTSFSNTAYNFTLTENSFHTSSLFTLRYGSGDSSKSNENDKCVTCHMGTAPGEEEAGYRLIGGHTWTMSSGSTEFVSSCTPCHTSLSSHNRTARGDYDGDGSIEGIQSEISGLLLSLTNKLKVIDATHLAGGTTQAGDGTITVAAMTYGASTSQATQNATNIDVRRAMYNYNLIARDGSLGAHNAAFAIQVLQKTYSSISQLNGGNSFATDFPNAVIR